MIIDANIPVQLASDEHCELLVEGCRYTMTIHHVTLEDEAEYTVKIDETILSKATLWVEGRIFDYLRTTYSFLNEAETVYTSYFSCAL